MARFNRINLDGKSVTETRTSAVDLQPGAAVVINGNAFAKAGNRAVKPLYIVKPAHLQGLTADEVVPAGDSVEGEYLEEGRTLAVLCAAGAALNIDTPLAVGADGIFRIATSSEGGSPEVPAVPSTYTSGGTGAVADFSSAAVTFKVNDVQVVLDTDLTDTEGVVAAISGQLTASGVAVTGTSSIVLTNSAGTGITVQAMTGDIDTVFGNAPVYVVGSPLVPAVPAGTDPVLAYAKEAYTVSADKNQLVLVRGA